MNGMRPLLSALDERAGAELSDWLLGFVAAYDPHAGNALRGLHPAGIDPELGEGGYGLGLARRIGRLHAVAYEGSVPALFEGAEGWDPATRAAYTWGVGCGLGELWGHDPSWLDPALGALRPLDREGIEGAFGRCASSVYLR